MRDKEELEELIRKSIKRDTDFSEQTIDTIVDVVIKHTTNIVKEVNEIDSLMEREQALHTAIMTIISNIRLPPTSRIGIAETVAYALKKGTTKVKNVGGKKKGLGDHVKSMFG